jgi:hypothetical protein
VNQQVVTSLQDRPVTKTKDAGTSQARKYPFGEWLSDLTFVCNRRNLMRAVRFHASDLGSSPLQYRHSYELSSLTGAHYAHPQVGFELTDKLTYRWVCSHISRLYELLLPNESSNSAQD